MLMNVSDVSPKDRAANAAAVFMAAEEGAGPDDLYLPPRVELAGIRLDFYARDGVAVVEVNMEHADPEVFRMTEVGGRASPALAINLGEGRPLVATAVPAGPAYKGRRRKEGD